MESPAKRRKTSPTTSVPADASNTKPTSIAPSNTPKHASFQSPTKASLARSHPSLLPKASAQVQDARVTRSGGPRRESLIDQVLGNKRRSSALPALTALASQGSRSRPQTPAIDLASHPQAAAPSSVPVPESLSIAVARTLQQDKSSNAQQSATESKGSRPNALVNAPLRKQQTSRTAQNDDFFDTGPSNNDGQEPELPPTPTQLGISPQPDKPRGLSLSSSPSGRRERRLAKEAAAGYILNSSPLKPRDDENRELIDSEPDPLLESGAIEADEIVAEQNAQQSHEGDQDRQDPDEEDAEPQERHQYKRTLKAQLNRLEAETQRVKSLLASTAGDGEDPEVEEELQGLLTTDNPSCLTPFAAMNARLASDPATPEIISSAVNDFQHRFHTMFAPGNVQLETTTSIKSLDDEMIQSHLMTLRAPAPFPRSTFSLSLWVDVSVSDQRILSISLVPDPRHSGHTSLREWIAARLKYQASRRLKFRSRDVGALFWGAGMYWLAMVKRARVWHHLDNGIDPLISESEWSQTDSDIYGVGNEVDDGHRVTTRQEVKDLLPYLTTTSMTFSEGQDPNTHGRAHQNTSNTPKSINLSYTFDMEWSGQPKAVLELSANGFRNPVRFSTGTITLTSISSSSTEEQLKRSFDDFRQLAPIAPALTNILDLVGILLPWKSRDL